MGLRHIHIAFIVVCLMFLAFLTAWSGARGFPLLCAAAAAGLALGIPYLNWFLGRGAHEGRSAAPHA